MKKLLTLALFTMAFTAQAKLITIDVTECGALDVEVGGVNLCTELENKIEDELNKDQPDVDLDKYAGGMANANLMAPKGLNSDYANDFDLFLIGAGAGVALQAPSLSAEADEIEGAALNAPVLILGAPLKLLPVKKLGPIDLNKNESV